MRKRLTITAVSLAVVAMCAADARAQLFGTRTLGQPLSRRPKPGSAEKAEAGTITGAERFLRENREAGDFVGGSAADRTRFVGQAQANTTEGVTLATENLTPQVDRSAQLNPPLPRRRRIDMYEPKFVVAFPVNLPTAETVQISLRERLKAFPGNDRYRHVAVTVNGDIARLAGNVASEDDRQALAALVLLEPGIMGVQNEVVVALPPSPPPSGITPSPSLPALPGRETRDD